jgi:RNA-directed DNA polymerase
LATEGQLYSIIKLAPTSYKIFYIDKKYSNKKRKICQPSKETKMLQYYLLDNFFPQFNVHATAMAYVKGKKSPLKTNALTHSAFDYSAHFDFENFFPSIYPEDLITVFKQDSCKNDIEIIKNICFMLDKSKLKLTIGAPVSPIISNIIMYKIDEILSKKAHDLGGVYTRYADDIWFSANTQKDCKEFQHFLNEQIEKNSTPKLKINEKKTYFYKENEPRRVTGLIISSEREIKVSRSLKRHLRSLIFRSIETPLNPKEVSVLKGYMAFLKDNEPDYVNTLFIKYGETLNKFY